MNYQTLKSKPADCALPESVVYKASAPGSVMVLGEHAVLHGADAVVAAVNRRVTASLIPRTDSIIRIESKLGNYKIDIKKIKKNIAPQSFAFVVETIRRFRDQLPSGFLLKIQAECSDKIGFGTSAAVTVATIAVLQEWMMGKIDADAIYYLGVSIIRFVQHGLGSGADVAASTFGGVLQYQSRSFSEKRLADDLPFFLVYTGYKTPTEQVIKKVKRFAATHRTLVRKLYDLIHECSLWGAQAITAKKFDVLGAIFYMQHALLQALEVSDNTLDKIVDRLRQIPTVFGAKISGSGLGDCSIALGAIENVKSLAPYKIIKVAVDAEGVRDERS